MQPASSKFIVLRKVDSTNNYAMALIQEGGATDAMGIFALHQTAGKGRLAKKWESDAGKNIILSTVAQMQWLQVYQQFQLSVAAALACKQFFLQFIKNGIKIKWPNDIYLNDSKAGGILIENQLQGNLWQWSVIGTGLNINEDNFDNKDFRAVSLKQITGKQYDVVELGKQLHQLVIEYINKLKVNQFDDMLNDYNEHLFCRGEKVKLKKGNMIFETTIEKISPTGQLLTADTIQRVFEFNEVSWLI